MAGQFFAIKTNLALPWRNVFRVVLHPRLYLPLFITSLIQHSHFASHWNWAHYQWKLWLVNCYLSLQTRVDGIGRLWRLGCFFDWRHGGQSATRNNLQTGSRIPNNCACANQIRSQIMPTCTNHQWQQTTPHFECNMMDDTSKTKIKNIEWTTQHGHNTQKYVFETWNGRPWHDNKQTAKIQVISDGLCWFHCVQNLKRSPQTITDQPTNQPIDMVTLDYPHKPTLDTATTHNTLPPPQSYSSNLSTQCPPTTAISLNLSIPSHLNPAFPPQISLTLTPSTTHGNNKLQTDETCCKTLKFVYNSLAFRPMNNKTQIVFVCMSKNHAICTQITHNAHRSFSLP